MALTIAMALIRNNFEWGAVRDVQKLWADFGADVQDRCGIVSSGGWLGWGGGGLLLIPLK